MIGSVRAAALGFGLWLTLLLLAGCGASSKPYPSLGSSNKGGSSWVPISGNTYGSGATVAEVTAVATNPGPIRLEVTASPDVVTTTSYEVDCDAAKVVGARTTGSTPLTRPLRLPRGPTADMQCTVTARATKPVSASMTVKLLERPSRAG